MRVAALVFVGYASGSLVSFYVFDALDVAAVFFPPAGVTLAALVLTAKRRWPWVLAAAAAAEFVVDVSQGLMPPYTWGFMLANTVEPLVGAYLLRRYVPRLDLSRPRHLAHFVTWAVIVGPLVGAVIGATTIVWWRDITWATGFAPYWAGDALGVLTVGGTILVWATQPRRVRQRSEQLVAVALICATTVVGFIPDVPLVYLPLPFLFIAAVRYGPRMVATSGLLMTLIANVMASYGHGPWQSLSDSPRLELAALQMFLAIAIVGAWILATEVAEKERQRERTRAESFAHRRLQSLQTLTMRLARAVTPEQVIRQTLSYISGRDPIAAAIVVQQRSGGGTSLWEADDSAHERDVMHRDVTPKEPMRQFVTTDGSYRHTRDDRGPALPFAAWPASFRRGDAGTMLSARIPLDGIRGARLLLGFRADEEVPDAWLSQAQTLATLVGQALQRAELYEQERANAQALQLALLPLIPPRLPGIAAHGEYRPADSAFDVGGDWYDVFALPSGRIAFVVGDVIGHDLRAAAAMGRLHSILRLTAQSEVGPKAVLDALDRECESIDGASMATVGYGEYDPSTGDVVYACGGHLPPLLCDPSAPPRFLDEGRSTPLGVLPGGVERTEATVQVAPGMVLVWYSDGLIERRSENIELGLERLKALASRAALSPADEWCKNTIDRLRGGQQDDDAVLLHLTFEG